MHQQRRNDGAARGFFFALPFALIAWGTGIVVAIVVVTLVVGP